MPGLAALPQQIVGEVFLFLAAQRRRLIGLKPGPDLAAKSFLLGSIAEVHRGAPLFESRARIRFSTIVYTKSRAIAARDGRNLLRGSTSAIVLGSDGSQSLISNASHQSVLIPMCRLRALLP